MIFKRKLRSIETANPAVEFEAQLALSAQSSKRIAWIIAGACLILTCLALFAIIVMLPLKQTVPYLIYVDKVTGITQVVDVATPSKITQDDVNAKHWVTRYVQARERYIYQLLQEDYDKKFIQRFLSPVPQKKTQRFEIKLKNVFACSPCN